MDVISRIEGRIAELKTELAELETALRVNQRMLNGDAASARRDAALTVRPVTPAIAREGVGKDLSGKTVREAAAQILSETSTPLYYKEVFKQAIARGYNSGRKGSTGSPVSFWAILKRNPDQFAPVGAGLFKLKESK